MSLDTIIELKNASIFQKDNLVLSDVNFEVNKGEFIYLIGKTGTGKSSLLKTFYADLPLTKGQGKIVKYDLQKIKRKEIPYLRRKVGIVFQDFQLLVDRTVYDNLAFVLKATGWKNKKIIDSRISEVLEKVDLSYKDYKMPHQLSGGEQQRVVIARALLNNPDVILADEPTGNLDPETSEGIMQLLFKISESGRTVVMATHDYNMLKKFPARTFRCEEGKLIENPKEVIDFSQLS
ncbi:MAG: phosphonate ABC transporter ATP-binding protein [Bacteroidetes bacterium]|nr:MAG: phosphonate ABC transporter ATP-binding protein [Bacteroidota bacterium]